MPSISRRNNASTYRVRCGEQYASEPDEALAYVRAAHMLDPHVLDRWRRSYGSATKRKAGPKRKHEEPPLLSHEQVDQALRLAANEGPSLYWLVRLLATYGHRPVSMARLRAGDLQGDELVVRVKNHSGGWRHHRHPLFRDHAQALRELSADMRPDEPLLRNPYGEGWSILTRSRTGDQTSEQMLRWFQRMVGSVVETSTARGMRGIYRLKDYAITSMFLGWRDWASSGPMSDFEVVTITGHDSVLSLAHYRKQSRELMRRRMAGESIDPPPFPALAA